MKTENTLTLKEAIDQGYTHVCYGHPSNRYQTITPIEHVLQQEIDEGEVYLAGKETFKPAGIDPDELKRLIADQIAIDHEDNTGDDTDTVYDAIMEMDFSDVSERIDKKLDRLNHYRWITEIKLK